MHVITLKKKDVGESLNCIFPIGKSKSQHERHEIFLAKWEPWFIAPKSVLSIAFSALLKD